MAEELEKLIARLYNRSATDRELKEQQRRAESVLDAFQRSVEDLQNRNREAIARLADEREEERLSAEVAAEMDELQRQLTADRLVEVPAVKPKETDYLLAFDGLRKELEQTVVGQTAFLKDLVTAFKRPFVMGTEEKQAKNVILVTGRPGTGRRSALRAITVSLKSRGVLDSDEIRTMDLSLYPGQTEGKLFLQDLYMAMQSGAQVLLFERYEACHPAFLKMLAKLAVTGTLPLSSRYVQQKGLLVDAGTALTSSAVGALHLNGQFLVFLTEQTKNKVAGAFGAEFIDAVGDTCTTGDFSADALRQIGSVLADELIGKCENRLKIRLDHTDCLPDLFVRHFTPEKGVCSMQAYGDECYRAFSEYRLDLDSGEALTAALSVLDGQLLEVDFGHGAVSLLSLLPAGYSGDLAEVRAELKNIVGLAEVKDYILKLEDNVKVQAMRKAQGMKTTAPVMHMIFTGNPGTGKTTIARILAKYLKAIGALSGGQLVEVSRADLVGRYVGHTAPQTRQVIESALGGVLFIDEAYSLYRGEEDSFGLEAIDTLVKCMEDHRDNLVVVLAGYTAEMEAFLTANSGLRSRFPNKIDFPDYTGEELLKIAGITAAGKGYRLHTECEEPLLAWFTAVQADRAKDSGNGRMVRNMLEAAILRQAVRVMDGKAEELDLLRLKDFELPEP